MFIKWATWVIPGFIAVSQLGAATDEFFIDQAQSDGDPQLETETQKQLMQAENSLTETSNELESSEAQGKPQTRFGIGYEFRQNLRSEIIERPDLPERPQRPERPDVPGRFGQ